jgi:hypothetical protein
LLDDCHVSPAFTSALVDLGPRNRSKGIRRANLGRVLVVPLLVGWIDPLARLLAAIIALYPRFVEAHVGSCPAPISFQCRPALGISCAKATCRMVLPKVEARRIRDPKCLVAWFERFDCHVSQGQDGGLLKPRFPIGP